MLFVCSLAQLHANAANWQIKNKSGELGYKIACYLYNSRQQQQNGIMCTLDPPRLWHVES